MLILIRLLRHNLIYYLLLCSRLLLDCLPLLFSGRRRGRRGSLLTFLHVRGRLQDSAGDLVLVAVFRYLLIAGGDRVADELAHYLLLLLSSYFRPPFDHFIKFLLFLLLYSCIHCRLQVLL